MRKLCITLALMLTSYLASFAQAEQRTLPKDEVKTTSLAKETRPRFSFVSAGLGGSALIDAGAYGVSAQIVDINISTKGMGNLGIRALWGGAAYFGAGEQHICLGPSCSFQAGNTIGTSSFILGGISSLGGHDPVPPSERPAGQDTKQWDFVVGASYKHRFFTKHLFNLSVGVDVITDFGDLIVSPNIGFAICW